MSTSMTIEDSRNEGAAHALERAAYHEAGHAVVALEFHRPFRQVSIIPDEDSLSPVMKMPHLGVWQRFETEWAIRPLRTDIRSVYARRLRYH